MTTTPQITTASGDEARVAGFVWTVYDDLDAIVAMREDLLFIRDGRRDSILLLRSLEAAWKEVAAGRADLVLTVWRDIPDGKLSGIGLSGAQLDLKLHAWLQARAHVYEILRSVEGPPLDRLLPPTEDTSQVSHDMKELPSNLPVEPKLPVVRVPNTKRPLKRLLKWISRTLGHADTILGSLASVVSQAESLREFKECLEKTTGEIADEI